MNNDIDNMIKKAGLRLTSPRRQVLRVIMKNPNKPLSIDELLTLLPANFDRVTAYRIINCFADKGLVEKINYMSNNLKVVVSPRLRKTHKHIVTCRICGSTFTAGVCVQADWREKLSGLGFTDVSHNLSFSGICSNH